MNAEEPTPQRNTLYDYNGPDTKTCARLISLLVENKSARLVKLQYTQEGVLESKEVRLGGAAVTITCGMLLALVQSVPVIMYHSVQEGVLESKEVRRRKVQ
jgi:hypothetical protein